MPPSGLPTLARSSSRPHREAEFNRGSPQLIVSQNGPLGQSRSAACRVREGRSFNPDEFAIALEQAGGTEYWPISYPPCGIAQVGGAKKNPPQLIDALRAGC